MKFNGSATSGSSNIKPITNFLPHVAENFLIGICTGLSDPCRFTRPDRWNVASSLKTNLFIIVSYSSGFPRKSQQKSCPFTLSEGFSCCRICNRYGRRWRSFRRTCQTVVFGTLSSLLARRTDLCGLRTNDCRMVSTRSALTDGLPVLLPLHAQPSVTKRVYQARTESWPGGLFPYFRGNWLHCNNRFRFTKR
jgi:hypothetical protein